MGIHEQRTVPELFTDLIAQVTSLFRTETRLARAKINEKIAQAGGGVAMIVDQGHRGAGGLKSYSLGI